MIIRLLIAAVLIALALGAQRVVAVVAPGAPPFAPTIVASFCFVLAAIVLLNALLHVVPRRYARVFEVGFTTLLLVGLIGGIAYVNFVFKPQMIKGFISKAFGSAVATVMAAPAQSQTWLPTLQAIGTFRASEGIDVAPQIGGWIAARHFESGDKVKVGQLLVEIDTSTEQADLKNGLALLKNADIGLDRQKSLLISSNTSKSTFDSAVATRDTAAAVVERYRAIINQKLLKAPFAGRLGIRKVDVGQYVSPGMSLVTLQKLTPIYVDFSVPEQNLNVLRTGQSVDVKVDAYPETFTGKVQSIDARVSQDTRNVLVRAVFENKDERLLPGMFANVIVVAGKSREVVTVPRTAVTYSLYGDSVYVVKPEVKNPEVAPSPEAQKLVAAGPVSPATASPATASPAAATAGSAKASAVGAKATPAVSAATAEFGAAAQATASITAGARAAVAAETPLVVERRFVRVGETKADAVAIIEGISPGDIVVTGGQIKLQPNSHVKINSNAVLTPPVQRPRA